MKTYNPQINVNLIKPKPRDNISELDITNWLGDGLVVETSKSVHQASGTFMITLPDQPYQGVSLYDLLDPMDFFEIRMAHDASHSNGGDYPWLCYWYFTQWIHQWRQTATLGKNIGTRLWQAATDYSDRLFTR